MSPKLYRVLVLGVIWLGDKGVLNGDALSGDTVKFFLPGNLKKEKKRFR